MTCHRRTPAAAPASIIAGVPWPPWSTTTLIPSNCGSRSTSSSSRTKLERGRLRGLAEIRQPGLDVAALDDVQDVGHWARYL